MITLCRDCGVEMWSTKVVGRRKEVCQECQKRRHRVRNARRYQAIRTGLITTVAPYIMAGDAPRRQRCDRALNRGKCHRRCQQCYRLYHLDSFETPCPNCGSHLLATPVTFEEAPHVHLSAA